MKIIPIYHTPERYENIFNLYEYDGEVPYTFYNLLNKISLPQDIDRNILDLYKVESLMPWTTISYRIYETQHLWWLLCLLNNIENPVKLLEAGSKIYAVKPQYLNDIYSNLKFKL